MDKLKNTFRGFLNVLKSFTPSPEHKKACCNFLHALLMDDIINRK